MDLNKIVSPWATHQHPLIAAVMNTTGPVLELGCGPFSTPMLHEICKAQKRFLLSFDLEKKWIDKFIHLEGDGHHMHPIEQEIGWGNVGMTRKLWGVIFIDHSPANRRQIEIERLKDACEFMVVHDTDKMKYYGYNFSMFKYKYVYTRFKKTTTILSQTRDPKELFE